MQPPIHRKSLRAHIGWCSKFPDGSDCWEGKSYCHRAFPFQNPFPPYTSQLLDWNGNNEVLIRHLGASCTERFAKPPRDCRSNLQSQHSPLPKHMHMPQANGKDWSQPSLCQMYLDWCPAFGSWLIQHSTLGAALIVGSGLFHEIPHQLDIRDPSRLFRSRRI